MIMMMVMAKEHVFKCWSSVRRGAAAPRLHIGKLTRYLWFNSGCWRHGSTSAAAARCGPRAFDWLGRLASVAVGDVPDHGTGNRYDTAVCNRYHQPGGPAAQAWTHAPKGNWALHRKGQR